jgi:hypothetical protein
MASNDRSLSGRIARWRNLFTNAQELLPEVPHLEGDLQELRGIEDEVSALRAERMIQEAKLREITLKIRKLAKKGDSIRARIGAGLKGRYGFDSFLLIQCGFTPRKKGIDRGPKLSAEEEARLDPRPSPSALSPARPGAEDEKSARGAGEEEG